jgi:hypothetical protein
MSNHAAQRPEEASGVAVWEVVEFRGGGRREELHYITDVKKANCRYCKKLIDRSATTCLYCQSDVRSWAAHHALFIIVGSVLMSLFLMVLVLNVWKIFKN